MFTHISRMLCVPVFLCRADMHQHGRLVMASAPGAELSCADVSGGGRKHLRLHLRKHLRLRRHKAEISGSLSDLSCRERLREAQALSLTLTCWV